MFIIESSKALTPLLKCSNSIDLDYSNDNHLYSLHKRHIKHYAKEIPMCIYSSLHKKTHILLKKTHKMLHKKVCIDYCKILENVKATVIFMVN